jgi:hypothetical protein
MSAHLLLLYKIIAIGVLTLTMSVTNVLTAAGVSRAFIYHVSCYYPIV